MTCFIWEKQHWVIGDYQIEVQEPYPYQNGEQTRHAKVMLTSILLHEYQGETTSAPRKKNQIQHYGKSYIKTQNITKLALILMVGVQ